MTDDKPPASPAPPSKTDGDSALAVWLKLGGLLVALSAFGALIFWLSRIAATH